MFKVEVVNTRNIEDVVQTGHQGMNMQRTPIFAAPLLLGLMACKQGWNGTQIGVGHMLYCEEVSSELLSDLEAIPEGLSLSPLDAIEGLSGTFSGPQGLEEGESAGEDASLITSAASQEVRLIRYEPSDAEVDPIHCPPNYEVELDFALTADGMPGLQTSLTTRISSEGEASAEGVDLEFDAPLPEPTAFNPDDFDTVESHVRLQGYDASWSVSIYWLAMNLEGVEEGQDVPQWSETLLGATLVAQ